MNKQPLNIVKVTGEFPPARRSGTAAAAIGLCKALIHEGHSVRVLTTNIDGSQLTQTPASWAIVEGVPVRHFAAQRKPLPYRAPGMVRELETMLPQADIVLIDSVFAAFGPPIARACRRHGVPYVVYPHGCLSRERRRTSRWRKAVWWYAVDRPMFRHATAIVALTRQEEIELRALGLTNPVHVIPNGVPKMQLPEKTLATRAKTNKPTSVRDPAKILTLGRLDPIKGIDRLIRALPQVLANEPNATLVIAGPDEKGWRAILEKLAEAQGVRNSVQFLGAVTEEQKMHLYSTCGIFVLPTRAEGFPMVLLEAIAQGAPVVTTPEANFPEIQTSGAGLVVAGNPYSLSTAILALLEDQAMATRMGASGRKLAQAYSWEQVAQRTVAMCRAPSNAQRTDAPTEAMK